jgi:BirA family biotin operon repressor/biotin-[acetyl-CoA-carboxylase] ligase
MDETLLRSLLKGPAPFQVYDEVDSTNRVVRAWAAQGAPHGAAVIALRQSAGRGRLGRAFYSPPGGLYLSVLVRRDITAPGSLTTLAAVAVLQAVQAVLQKDLCIKWVNDLLLDGKKVCGILTESVVWDNAIQAAVVGIGINVDRTDFPDEIAGKAGSLLLGAAAPGVMERLTAAVVNGLLSGIDAMPGHMAAYRAHCLTLGAQVRFEQAGAVRQGKAAAIGDQGELLIDTPDGQITLMSGEASVRMEDGEYV